MLPLFTASQLNEGIKRVPLGKDAISARITASGLPSLQPNDLNKECVIGHDAETAYVGDKLFRFSGHLQIILSRYGY